MDRVSVIWIGDGTSHDFSLKLTLIQGRVLTFFCSVRVEGGEEAVEGKSEARRGWWCALRNEVLSVTVQGGTAGADGEAVVRSPEGLAGTVNEGGYAKHQVFSGDRTPFCWKKMPSWSSVAGKRSVPSFRGQAAPLFGAHEAAGGFKLKPMLTYLPKVLGPRELREIALLCEWNSKAWMTVLCPQHGLLSLVH